AKLEPYEFGVTWQRGDAAMRLLQPFNRAITAHSWAWTAGTGGKSVAGPVVTAEDSTRLDDQRKLRATLMADTSAPAVLARRQFQLDLPYILKAAGALGTLID